jgi:hypothetical protein
LRCFTFFIALDKKEKNKKKKEVGKQKISICLLYYLYYYSGAVWVLLKLFTTVAVLLLSQLMLLHLISSISISIYKVVAGTSSSSFSYKSDFYNQLYFYSLGRIYCT